MSGGALEGDTGKRNDIVGVLSRLCQRVDIPLVRRVQQRAFVPDGRDLDVRAQVLGGFAQPAVEFGAAGGVEIAAAALDEPCAGFFVDLRVEIRLRMRVHAGAPAYAFSSRWRNCSNAFIRYFLAMGREVPRRAAISSNDNPSRRDIMKAARTLGESWSRALCNCSRHWCASTSSAGSA